MDIHVRGWVLDLFWDWVGKNGVPLPPLSFAQALVDGHQTMIELQRLQ